MSYHHMRCDVGALLRSGHIACHVELICTDNATRGVFLARTANFQRRSPQITKCLCLRNKYRDRRRQSWGRHYRSILFFWCGLSVIHVGNFGKTGDWIFLATSPRPSLIASLAYFQPWLRCKRQCLASGETLRYTAPMTLPTAKWPLVLLAK